MDSSVERYHFQMHRLAERAKRIALLASEIRFAMFKRHNLLNRVLLINKSGVFIPYKATVVVLIISWPAAKTLLLLLVVVGWAGRKENGAKHIHPKLIVNFSQGLRLYPSRGFHYRSTMAEL